MKKVNGKVNMTEVQIAWVKLAPDAAPVTGDDLREFCKGKIAHFEIPKNYKDCNCSAVIKDSILLLQPHRSQQEFAMQFLIRIWGPARFQSARLICALLICCAILLSTSVAAQQPPDSSQDKPVSASAPDDDTDTPNRVDVDPVATDDEIRQRITDILQTTGWFGEPGVTVQKGIVRLNGTTENDESRQWAGDLARNTEGVVAVLNEIEVAPTKVWDFDPAHQELNDLARGLVQFLPLIVVAVVVLVISWIFARLTTYALRRRLLDRSGSQLLREVSARTGGVLVMLVGFYLVLRIAGLTQLALTLVGGTGLIGLVLGIAFRDITENFLASLFLSLQQPFREGNVHLSPQPRHHSPPTNPFCPGNHRAIVGNSITSSRLTAFFSGGGR
ncbi:BON domain-containing protein [Marinobacter halophilus]|nr:BON domain-containing protein [Marinobacter halophilus]